MIAPYFCLNKKIIKLMIRKTLFFIFVISLLINNKGFSNENLLTLKQQLDRLQRDVNDLSKIVYNKNFKPKDNLSENDETINFSAIDIRIYDLEKDIKALTLNLEELAFQIEDLFNNIKSLEQNISFQIDNITNLKNDVDLNVANKEIKLNEEIKEKNTLGTLVVSSEKNDLIEETTDNLAVQNNDLNDQEFIDLPAEEAFQLALDQMRLKEYDQAKILLKLFINKYQENQLSGSAHFWLGKIFIIESNFREAVFIFGEGVQKYPKSIKTPNMLYEMSNSLFAMNKNEEACKTMQMVNEDYSKSKISQLAKKKIIQMGCNNTD